MEFIIKLLLYAVAILVTSRLLSGIHVKNFTSAVIVGLVLTVLNMWLKPIMIILTLPVTILTLGVFLLIINAAIIKITAWIIGDGFKVDSWFWAILFSLILTVINGILEFLFI